MSVDNWTTADVGAYTYGLGHPMKPHRIQVAHELVTAYDMLPKMQVLVSSTSCSVLTLELMPSIAGKACFSRNDDEIPHRRICSLPESSDAGDSGGADV